MGKFANADEAMDVLMPVLRQLDGEEGGGQLLAPARTPRSVDAQVFADCAEPARMDAARAWLRAAVACAQEREGMMTRREVLEEICEAHVCAAHTGSVRFMGTAFGLAMTLVGWDAMADTGLDLPRELALLMDAERSGDDGDA